ncbi:MAG: phosphate/phosphite/phosphonate ABC transporter substrate-binding protein [Nitrospirae bacterium]|nr:phosphate/phosphite/phosphonate ABC transporter substrate-binding protein [Nitrospirota bacterium]MCL5236994.1 phosphate/phosphite/phosphonate ABC transporter substrate-binding protein [Nitrospirota bacterium]
MNRILVIAMIVFFSGYAYAAELTIGLIPEQNVFKQKERYKPLGEYIEKKTGIKIKFTILSRYGNIIERFTSEKMDGAFFGSFTGALAIQKLGVEPIARPVNLDNASTYCGYIFVRKDSRIKTVHDMKGKRLVFVEKATTAGYAYPMSYFKEHGINDINTYFKEYYFAGSHDAAIYAVLNKKSDIGCAKHSMFDRVARRDPRIEKELTILVKSPDVPSNGLGVRRDLSAAVKTQLRKVLLGMDKDPEGKEVLKKFEAIGFLPTTKEDYKPVFDIARKAGIDIKNYKYRNE